MFYVPKNTGKHSSPEARDQSNSAWIARQTATPADRREYEQERLIAWIFEVLAESMETQGLTKADLARALNTSRAHITQLFSGQRNATLRTLADLAWACESRVTVTLEPLRQGEFVDMPVRLVRHTRPRFDVATNDAEDAECAKIEELVA